MMLRYLEYFLPDSCPTSPCPVNEEFPFTSQWGREISLNNDLGDLTQKDDLAILVEKNLLHPDSLERILQDAKAERSMVYRLAGDRPLWVLPQRSLDHPAILVSDGSSWTWRIEVHSRRGIFTVEYVQAIFDAPSSTGGKVITEEEDYYQALRCALEEGKRRNLPVLDYTSEDEGGRKVLYQPEKEGV